MRQADRRRRLRATITTKRHFQMAPRTTQTIPSSPLLALFVLLGFRLGIRARVVITHAAWVVASAMARAEARTGVRTTRRAAADVQRECYVSSDASGGASGGVVGGARCGACARQRAAEQQAQKHTRRADRELRQQRKADFRRDAIAFGEKARKNAKRIITTSMDVDTRYKHHRAGFL